MSAREKGEGEILSIMGISDQVSIVERIRPSVYHGQIQNNCLSWKKLKCLSWKEIFINEVIHGDVS